MEKLMEINWSERELLSHKNRIMRRVYWVWFFKKVLAPAVFVLVVSGFILVKELSRINLGIIFTNILERVAKLELLGLVNYFLVAISQTELDSLLIMASSTLLALFFGRRLIRETLVFTTRKASLPLLK